MRSSAAGEHEDAPIASRRRKPYARLDRESIVDAGMAVARRPDTETISFRTLGEHLGADPTAIYRHFRNKDELLAALVDRVVGVVAQRLTGDPEGDWKQYLFDGAVTFQDVFLEHPALGVHVAGTRPLGAAELRLLDLTLAALHHAGLRDDELMRSYGAYAGVLLSFTAMLCHDRLAVRAENHVTWMRPSVEISAEEHPALFEQRERFAAVELRQSYLTAIEVVLDAAERAAGSGEPASRS